jgi:hypothetical protein
MPAELLQCIIEIGRVGSRKIQDFTGEWVSQAERDCVEPGAPEERFLTFQGWLKAGLNLGWIDPITAAVQWVPGQREAQRRQVRADLVRATSLRMGFDEGVPWRRRNDGRLTVDDG